MANKFKVGDIVRKPAGHTEYRVTNVDHYNYLNLRNCNTQKMMYSEHTSHYVIVRDKDDTIVTNKNPDGKLFQTITEPHLRGIWLAVNANGKVVLDMEGQNSTYREFDKDEIEQVMPYTVRVKFIAVSPRDDTQADVSKPGELAVGRYQD
jgi:hypothetical protein